MTTKTDTIAVSNFAENRHKENMPYSHYMGSSEALCKMVSEGERVNISPDGGVFKVTVPGDGFFSGMTQVNRATELKGHYANRPYSVDGEYPYMSFTALAGSKVPGVETDLICYTKAKLAENNEGSTDADVEVISVNVKTFKGEEPPHPVTMLRNARNYPGGTKATYTVEELLASIEHHIGGGPRAPYVMLEAN